MPRSTQLDKERIATSTPESEAGVLVVRRHQLPVRCSHRLNVPILLGLILSGLSIYWAPPVYQHKPVKILYREACREHGADNLQEMLGVPRSANRFAAIEELRVKAVEAT